MAEVFISHASADDGFVAELRRWLDGFGVPVWVDSRELRPGDRLAPEIEAAIVGASGVLAVLSPATVNSPWVGREIRAALAAGVRVVPILLPGITPRALELWFPEEPVALPVELGPGGLSAAGPALLAALGHRLPTDHQPFEEPDAKPVEELVLKLTDPRIDTADGRRRAQATATLVYEPARPGERQIESRRFRFTAPLGPIETADLKWYLESYHIWPVGLFRDRAEAIQARLPGWGRDLHAAALGGEEARAALTAWQDAAADADRRFSVMVDNDLPSGASDEERAAAAEAATELLSLPWELLHDGRGWLFQGRDPVRVRRRLPNRQRQAERPTELPVRILLISPRPATDDGGGPIGYLDHRVSARPLVEAVEELGELARLTVLQPPTYDALERALRDGDQGRPFDVVHFDGHGVYDRRLGLGGLCFEQPADPHRLDFVDAGRLAGLVRRHRIPLVFLEACQTAVAEVDPTASVAARLLDEGVTSVVAMSHSVLVETARRFVHRFYAELARGGRVGAAMLAGQQTLYADPVRGRVLGAGELRLQDWFVPVLYQEEQDPQLITRIPPAAVRQQQARRRHLGLGELPAPPEHEFRGRSQELLALERLLHAQPWVAVRGTGGQGKTTLAVELARWLVRTARFDRAAFVSLEHHRDARAALDTLGRQLVGPRYSVAEHPDLDAALRPVERALTDRGTVVVLDNCESVLAEPGEATAALLALATRLLAADPRTRLIFTTREPLPPPFADPGRHRELGALARADAIELVGEVMKRHGWTPPRIDAGDTPEQITELVEAVHRHARALVLLAPEVARRGVTTTTAELRSLMTRLAEQHPGDRENSLYASVELSLRRLPPDLREQVRVVAVAHGGIYLGVLAELARLEPAAVDRLAGGLIGVGLAEDMGDGHLRLDPGLPPYLLGELDDAELAGLRELWTAVMVAVTQFLHNDAGRNAARAGRLTVLELPNLLAMLDRLRIDRPPAAVVTVASMVEDLLRHQGRPRPLAHAIRIREEAARRLGDWSHARYIADATHIERLVDRGDYPAADAAVRELVSRTLAAGAEAYPGAAGDIADAHYHLGRILHTRGAIDAALAAFTEAERRFRQIAAAGEERAERMIGVILCASAICLVDLGRVETAGEVFEEALRRCRAGGDLRSAAIIEFELGTVRLLQQRHAEALAVYAEARAAFEALGEPRHVATAWHQIGMAHRYAGNFDAAEKAYRESLAIGVREDDLARQADSLGELGNLHTGTGRHEESVAFYRAAAEIYLRMRDLAKEGVTRSNLADVLVGLRRYDEARGELQRAVVCQQPYGHVAKSWVTWAVLEDLERATGRLPQARAARDEAIAAYLAYRRAGGESTSPRAGLYAMVSRALQQGGHEEAARLLDQADGADVVVDHLRAVLAGRRPDTAELRYLEAAELQLLGETA